MGIDIATDKGWSFAVFDHEPGITVLVAETGWWEGNGWVYGARLSSIDGDTLSDKEVTWNVIHKAPRDFILPLGSRDELARLFLSAAERVLEAHGEAGYNEVWNGRVGFPMRAMMALQAALNHPAGSPLNYAG